MPVEMRVTTMEKGGSGNASTNTIGAKNNSYTLSESNPLYEASLRYKKKKEEELEQENQKKLSEKRESDKKKAEYFSKTFQPFVSAYNQIVDATKGYFEGWQDERESAYTKGMFTSLQENLKKLKNSVSDNSYLQEVMSPDDYEKAISDLDLIGSSLNDAVDYVSNASSVYSQFSDADSYNKHTRLSGMSADDLQREIDALDKKIGDMGSADSYYDTMYVMGQPMKKATEKSKKFENDLTELERKKKELTSYRDTARLGENVKKYGVDPSKLSYEALTSYVNDKNLSMSDPGKYDFIKSYYDGMDAGEKADLFVNGLDPTTRDLYEKASELITKNSASNAAFSQGSTLSETSADLKRVDELIGIISSRTGFDEQTVRKNIGMVQRYMNAERAEDTGKAVVKAVEKAPVLSNIASVGLNLGGGLFALADQVGQTIANKIAGENETIDTNTAAQSIVKISDDIRNATRKKIEKSTNVTLPSGANLGAYLYDTAMSLADVVAQTSTGRVIGAGLSGKALNNAISATTSLIVGSNSAASTVQESVESGESSVKALAKGLAVGLIESLIEKAGIDNVLNATLRGDAAAKVILRSALAEGTEEVLTNIATEDFLESYVFGGSTRYQKAFESYISQGLSREEAAKRASADVVAQDAETFLSSALIGTVFGGVTAVSNRANDKANTKLAQDGINNELGGIGEIEFLKNVNLRMEIAQENLDDDALKDAARRINDRIERIRLIENDVKNNSSMRNVIGESGIQQEVAKMEANIATLTDKLNLIRNGEYDPTVQAYMISLMEEDLAKSTEEQAKSQRNVLKAAQMYLSAFGSEKKAVEAAKKTAAQENARAAELSAERSRLTEALTTADEAQKVEINRRIQEIGREIKRTARNVIRAGKVEKALGDQYRSAINSALGGNEKELSKRLTNALGREVKVAYDDNAKGFSSMKTGADSSTLTVNPELILRTENALRQEFGEEYTGNLAKEKLVHEIAHAAARSDANFDAKVLEIYHLLRDNGLITDDDIDEAATREAYKDTLKRYMATEPAKAEVRRLVEAGNAEADAIAAVENAYIGEELVAQTLEWMERSTNGQLSREILGEKRNVFVQALNRIAEIFRSVAAKLKGVDNVNAAKTAGFADKIERFAREFAERGVAEMNGGISAASQESAGATQSADNARGNSGEGAGASGESEATTGTQEEDERQSLNVGGTKTEGREDAKYSADVIDKYRNDFQKNYEMNVDAVLNGTYNSTDPLIIGRTPDVFEKIGFVQLPVSITPNHVYSVAKTLTEAKKDNRYKAKVNYHGLGADAVKGIMEKISDPIMIVLAPDSRTSSEKKRFSSHRVIAIVELEVDGNRVIAPIEVEADISTSGGNIDSNLVVTYFDRENIKKLISEVIALETIGETAIYYGNKKRIGDFVKQLGLQLPALFNDISDHETIIRDIGANVNRSLSNATQSKQFKRWFGDWQNNPQQASKVVNRDGTPRIVYHYTDGDFTVFDPSMSGNNQGKSHGDGIYVSTNPNEFSYAGKNKMELYANIRNPFEMQLTGKQADYVLDKYASANHDLDGNDGMYRAHAKSKLTTPSRVFDYLNQYADENGIKTSDILKDLGFDGVHDGSEWVAFDSNQLKSATDNIGLFDANNEDIRYSLSDEQRMKRMEEDKAFLEADFAKAERTSTVDEKKELGADLIRRFDLDKATAPKKLRDMFLLLERYATLASASDDAQEKSTAEAEAQPKSNRTYKIGDEVQKLEEVTSQIRQISRELIAESGGLDAELLLSENDAKGKEIIEEQANNLEMAAMLGYYAPVDENDTSNAYKARLSAIRKNMNMRMSRYIRRLERQADRITDLEDSAGGEKYRETIKKRTKAMRSMANNPNRKRFVEEKNRETVREITDWLDRVADATTAGGVGNLETELSTDALAAMEKKLLSLGDVFDEDSVDLMKMLLQQMAVNRDSYLEKEVNRELAMGRLLKTEKNLAWMMYKALRDQNRMELNGREYVANYIAGDLIDSLNNRRNVEKEFNTLETDEKGKILSSSDSGKILERMEKRTRKTRRWISLNTMDGYSFLRRMGKVGESLYDTLRAAQSEQIMHVQEYVKTLQDKLLKDQQDGAKGVDLSRYIGDKQKTVTVTLSSGEKYTMTAAQAMTIVTLYEREAGKSHIENGGVRLVHPKDKTLSAAVALKAEDVAAIAQNLDEDDRRVMKVMNDFIREQCTEWGNEATLERYGFYRFNTQHYFPITVDRNALPSNVSAEGAKDYLQFNVQNVGFAKAADASAKAPVVIDSFINVINRHVEGMATYAAYLNAEDIVNRLMSAPGVKDAMQRSLGTGSVKYMTDMMTELKQGNRGGSEDSLTQWWNKSAGHYKSAAVSYNLSTALKQPISIVRAAAVLDPKYILAAKRVPFSGTGKAAHEEMMQYSGIGVKKSVGYSDVGVSRDINAQIGYEKKDLSKKVRDVSEFGMALAGYMDERTWDSIWIACREEVKDKKPDLTANHEAFMNEVAKRFAEVVAQTQVVDSPLDSSPLSRSKSPLARNVFAFTSEPIKGFNLLMNAMDDLINAEKGSIRQKQAAAQMARTAVITLVGWAAEASISAAFQMIRDEDDDEGEIAKEFGVKFGKQMLSNAYNVVPYIGQLIDIVVDAWKGYDFTDMGIAPLADVINSAKELVDILRNPENKSETPWKAGRDLAESVATFFGVPVRNFVRDAFAVARLLFHGTDWYIHEYEMQKWFYNPKSSTAREKHEFNSLLTDAYLSGNKEAFEHIYNDMRSMGLSPQTIMNGIAKDAYAQDITSSGSTLTRYTPGSDAWYIGMKGIFDRDLSAPDGLEKELTRLYKATEEKGVLPKYKSDSYTVDGESKELSVKDHEAVLSEYSKLYYEIATILRNSPAYKNADDTLKAYWMAQAERYSCAVSIYRVDSEYNLRTKWWEKMKDKPYYDVAGYIITNLKPSKEDE